MMSSSPCAVVSGPTGTRALIDNSDEFVLDQEETVLLNKLLPYGKDQALELSSEVIKLLSKDYGFQEEFDIDEEPAPAKKSGMESWLSAVTIPAQQQQAGPWMKVSLELNSCLVRKVKAEVKFASKKGFSTQLGSEPTPGWVLEQALDTRKETEVACNALRQIAKLTFQEKDDLVRLCEYLDAASSSLSKARNALLFPNPLGFPRALRPFNGFTPPLGPDYLLDFSIFRDRLVVSAFRVAHLAPQAQQYPIAIVPDSWFEDPVPPAPSRFVGLTIPFEGGSVVRILETHSCSFQVALFTKIQVFLGDAHRVLRDLNMNVVGCLSSRPDFYLSAVHKPSATDHGDDPLMPLIQPSRQDASRRTRSGRMM